MCYKEIAKIHANSYARKMWLNIGRDEKKQQKKCNYLHPNVICSDYFDNMCMCTVGYLNID